MKQLRTASIWSARYIQGLYRYHKRSGDCGYQQKACSSRTMPDTDCCLTRNPSHPRLLSDAEKQCCCRPEAPQYALSFAGRLSCPILARTSWPQPDWPSITTHITQLLTVFTLQFPKTVMFQVAAAPEPASFRSVDPSPYLSPSCSHHHGRYCQAAQSTRSLRRRRR